MNLTSLDSEEANEIDMEDYQRKLEAESTARMISETIKRDYDLMEGRLPALCELILQK